MDESPIPENSESSDEDIRVRVTRSSRDRLSRLTDELDATQPGGIEAALAVFAARILKPDGPSDLLELSVRVDASE